ncbi:hypothetical protein Hanom_Chr16g01512511 [Helianthus anomalus]
MGMQCNHTPQSFFYYFHNNGLVTPSSPIASVISSYFLHCSDSIRSLYPDPLFFLQKILLQSFFWVFT